MRLAAGVRVAALVRQTMAAGGFATVLAKGDPDSGSIAVVAREAEEETVLAPVMAGDGYALAAVASGEAVAEWIERARRRDPDLWVVEVDMAGAALLAARVLGV
jgi:hypothetical protein